MNSQNESVKNEYYEKGRKLVLATPLTDSHDRKARSLIKEYVGKNIALCTCGEDNFLLSNLGNRKNRNRDKKKK